MNIAILRPLAATIGGSMNDAARMATPDPKEVAYSSGGATTIDLDLGSTQTVGAIYLGGASGTTTFTVTGGTVGYADATLGSLVVAPKRKARAPRQYLLTIEPRQLRYIRLSASLPSGYELGLAIAAERFTPEFGHEWGSGRYLTDTGTAHRNRAGGFGIERGAIAPGYDFTLGDLTNEETEELFDLVKEVGETNPIIVAEDPAVTNDLDARLHYGLFQRLEKYDRQRLNVVRWSLKVEEWA